LILKPILILLLISIKIFAEATEKKILYKLPYIGVNSMFISSPVDDCTEGCRSIGKWSFHLSDSLLDELFISGIDTLLKDRFITAEKVEDKLSLSTGKSVPHLGRDFQLGRVGYEHHKTRIGRYINRQHFKSAFKLLVGSSESYYMALYIDNIDSSYRLLPKNSDGYGVDLNLNLSINLAIFRYSSETDEFKLFKEFRGDSDREEKLFSELFSDGAKRLPHRPAERDGSKLFREELHKQFQVAMRDLSLSLQSDRVFRTPQRVTNISGSTILTSSKDLKVGSIATLYRVDKDEDYPIGWGRVFQKDSLQVVSDLNITKKSIVLEQPWSGYLFEVENRTGEREFNFENQTLNDSYTVTNLGFGIDLGYFSNISYLYNLWLNFRGGVVNSDFSYSRENISVNSDEVGNFSVESDSGYSYSFGLSRRLYLYRKLFLNLGVEWGREVGNYSISHDLQYRYYNQNGGETELQIDSEFLDSEVELGWSFSPDLELFFGANWREVLNSSNSLSIGGDRVDIETLSLLVDSGSLKWNSGVSYTIGLRFNTDLFSKMGGRESW
jgi:hypothetical protein